MQFSVLLLILADTINGLLCGAFLYDVVPSMRKLGLKKAETMGVIACFAMTYIDLGLRGIPMEQMLSSKPATLFVFFVLVAFRIFVAPKIKDVKWW